MRARAVLVVLWGLGCPLACTPQPVESGPFEPPAASSSGDPLPGGSSGGAMPSGTTSASTTGGTETGAQTGSPAGESSSSGADSSTGNGPPIIDPFGPDPEVIVVQDGIDHVEGPTWVPEEEGFVYHTRPNVHRLWRPFEESTSSWYELPGGNHGSHYSDGWVYLANRRPGEIARIRVSDLAYESLPVDLGGDVLSLPNDIDRFADGSLYFTDWGGASTPSNYVGFGVYRRHANGSVDAMLTDLDQPNGIAFTADCQSLYVTDHPRIMRYDVAPDGSLSNESIHFEIGGVNGIAVDSQDNLYTVGDRKVTAVNDEGEVVGLVDLQDHVPVNLAFGGDDRKTLLVTTGDGVLATRTLVAGAECNGLL